MKIICGCCGKEFNKKHPLINLCNKCAKKGSKLLQKIHDNNITILHRDLYNN